MASIDSLLKSAVKARDKAEQAMDEVNDMLKETFGDRIFVMYQPGDGYVYVASEECYNAPIEKILPSKLIKMDLDVALEFLRDSGI